MNTLFIKHGRRYAPAPTVEVLRVAEEIHDSLFVRGTVLNSPRSSADYLRAKIGMRPYESFSVLFLDNRNRVIAFEEMFRGTVDGAQVHPREVVRLAIARNAAAVVFAHNHPSGEAEPSASDLAVTRRLVDALALIDVRVLDHFVVGAREAVSMAERGLM